MHIAEQNLKKRKKKKRQELEKDKKIRVKFFKKRRVKDNCSLLLFNTGRKARACYLLLEGKKGKKRNVFNVPYFTIFRRSMAWII